MRPIRVAVLAERLGTSAGGTEVYERCLLNALHERAQEAGDIEIVPVLAWRRALEFLSPSLLPSCQLLFPEGKIGTILTAGLRLRCVYPDVIHCCFVVPPFAGCAPLVTTIHDLGFVFHKEHYPPLLAARLVQALHYAVRRSDRLVAVSDSTRQDMLAATNAGASQIETVYNGLDDRFTIDIGNQNSQAVLAQYGIRSPYLLYAGKLEPRKNVGTLIDAYDRLRTSGRFSGQLVLLGSPRTFMWREAQERIDRSPFRKHIQQTGFVPDAALPAIYAGAAALAFVSLYEGFGFPVVEAMASAVPVVCSNATCLPEIVGDAALLVNPEDPEDIAQSLARVLNDEALCRCLVAKGLERAKVFTWQCASTRILDIYRELAKRSTLTH